MLRKTLLAAAFLAVLPTFDAAAKPKRPPGKPAVTIAYYAGDKAPRGGWKALRSADLWSSLPTPSDEGMDELVSMHREWRLKRAMAEMEASAKTDIAREDCIAQAAQRKRSAKRCARIVVKPSIPADPIPLVARVGDDNASGLRAGLIRHMSSYARPDGWDEQVRLIQSEPDIERKLEMAASWVNERLVYYRRTTDPQGRSKDSPWFKEWSQGIEHMFRLGYGDCRDYSLAQYALAIEGGVPEDSIAIAALLMGSAPTTDALPEEARSKDIVHINVVAKTPRGTVVLAQSDDKPLVVKADRSSLANRGVLLVANASGARYLSPITNKLLASAPRTNTLVR